jgi:RNA polymerase sigma-70 factor (ECF subfamily)
MLEIEDDFLEKIQSMEPTVLAAVYDRYNDALFRYAYRLLGDRDRAEDCVAETFSRFLKAIHEGKGPRQAVRPYLYRIAHNWITDYYRRPSPETESLSENYSDPNNNPETLTNEKLEQVFVRNALLNLTPDQRQVIVLKFLEQWETAEIAKTLKKPVGAVKALQNRGLQALKKIMKV